MPPLVLRRNRIAAQVSAKSRTYQCALRTSSVFLRSLELIRVLCVRQSVINEKKTCVNPVAGPECQHCIHSVGVHNECLGNYLYSATVAYCRPVINERGCNECACDAAKDGGCLVTLAVYPDGACAQVPSHINNMSSFMPLCFDVTVPGQAIGWKRMSLPTYIPGTCPATGGEPFGKAVCGSSYRTPIACGPLLTSIAGVANCHIGRYGG